MKTKKESSTASSGKKGPIYKRPGRCVCVCTAKGKIVYIEDEFTFNKNKRR